MSNLNEQAIVESHLAQGEDLDRDRFPELGTLSSAFFYQFTPVAKQAGPPESVFLPARNIRRLELVGVLAIRNQ